MPEYHIYCCYSCGQYQVQQKKKSNKWQCRVCRAKQSVKKIFGKSYKAKDLRQLCQELNLNRGEREEIQSAAALKRAEEKQKRGPEKLQRVEETRPKQPPKTNSWNRFLEPVEVPSAPEPTPEDEKFVTAIPEGMQVVGNKKTYRNNTYANRGRKRQNVPTTDFSRPQKIQKITRKLPRTPKVAAQQLRADTKPKTQPIQPKRNSTWSDFKLTPKPATKQAPKPAAVQPKVTTANSWSKFIEEVPAEEKPVEVDGEGDDVWGSFADDQELGVDDTDITFT